MAEDLTKIAKFFFELNGQLRYVFIRDKTAAEELAAHPSKSRKGRERIGGGADAWHRHRSPSETRRQSGKGPAIGRLVGHENGNGRPVARHRFDLSILNLMLIIYILICKLGTVKTVDITKDMKLEGDDLLLTIEEAK